MKFTKATVLTFAERCKYLQTILAANWQGQLNTIKSDANGSKSDIYTSTVKYILRKGKPYIWIPEQDLHNVNIVVDERSSFSVASPFPGKLGSLLKSIEKLPARVAMTGDIVPCKDDQSAAESLEEVIFTENKAISESSYSVSSLLNSSDVFQTSRSKILKNLFDGDSKYNVYKFNARSCLFIDSNGQTQEVELEGMRTSKADRLASFSAQIIDGINQNEARRQALVLFCFTFLNARVKDAYMLSMDRKGFNVLGKVLLPGIDEDAYIEYDWKEYRISFQEEANDVESFCRQLMEMEEVAVKKVSVLTGL